MDDEIEDEYIVGPCEICKNQSVGQCEKCQGFFCYSHSKEWTFFCLSPDIFICKGCFDKFRPTAERIEAISDNAMKDATNLMKDFFGKDWEWEPHD